MRSAAALALFLLLVVPGAAPGQEQAGQAIEQPAEAATPAETAEQPAPIQPIAIPDVALRADAARRALRDIESSLPAEDAFAELADALAAFAERRQTELEETDAALETGAELTMLNEIGKDWRALISDVEKAQTTLRDGSATIEEHLKALDREREIWQATRKQATEGRAPAVLLKDVASVQQAIASTRKLAESRRAEVLTLSSRYVGLKKSAEEGLERLKEARSGAAGRLFQRDSEAIWSPKFPAAEFMPHSREVLTALGDELRSFASQSGPTIAFTLALLLLLTILLWAARTRVRRGAGRNESLARVAAVFERPISMAILLTTVATIGLYTEAPPGVTQLRFTIALIPAVLILRRLVEPPLFPFLTALVVLFFVDRLRQMIGVAPARLLFLGEMLAVAGLLLWLMRPARLAGLAAEAARSRLFRVAAVVGRIAIGVALVALLADALGYGVLARLLAEVMLSGAYLGMTLYAAARVANALLAFSVWVRPLRLLGMVRNHRPAFLRLSRRATGWGAVALWTWGIFRFIGIADDSWDLGGRILSAEASIGASSISLGDVVAFAFTIWAAFLISRFLRFALQEDVYPRSRLPRGATVSMSTLLHYTILVLGFLVAILATGIDLNRFALLAGAFGVGIAFGLQNIVNNVVSGLILLTDRQVQVGDTIEGTDMLGIVERIGIRSSTVRTWQGAEIIVPNAELVSERVINWTRSDRRRRIEIPIGVAYGTDPKRVIGVLIEVAKRHPEVLDTPEPAGLFCGFGDSSLDFEMRAWTDQFDSFMRIASELRVGITEALAEASITIPFPQRDLHVRSVVDASRPVSERESSED